ncbi:mitochondrial translation release factor in rescue [Anabrus simplex]|uniref:mitochondrial translation release factor in rescue n=1 Tax=Anabrus simplex TaxID=316456 RepID=UPI0035A365FD
MQSLLSLCTKVGQFGELKLCLLRQSRQEVVDIVCNRRKHTIDYSHFPTLLEDDLEEKFVRGSGPGGQAVNKTNNCVVLIHKPTGLVVKCHQSRLQDKNRHLARQLMLTRLDNLLNGEQSVEAQIEAARLKKGAEKTRRQRKLQDLKKEWKTREGLD